MRLATHVLILERGKTVASGPVTTLMSRPDLPWLRDAVGLGSVFDATVTRTFADRGLVELAFDGGTLLAADRGAGVGSDRSRAHPRARSHSGDAAAEGLSLHNVLPGTVSAIHADPAFDHAIVQIAVGRVLLLAEVTRDAIARLGIVGGHAGLRADQVRVDRRARGSGERPASCRAAQSSTTARRT